VKRGLIDAASSDDRAAVSELDTAAPQRRDDNAQQGGGALPNEGRSSSFPAGRRGEAAARKSPNTGAGVARRRGSGPRHGLIRGMRAILKPTGEEDAALDDVPLVFIRAEGDEDLARSVDLQNNELTFDVVARDQVLDSLVG
jgi:hypothetical protein